MLFSRFAKSPGVLAVLLVLLLSKLSVAQSFTSSITGRIIDPSSAPVSGATVELKNSDTNSVQQATSGSDGLYNFNNLNAGTFQITVTAPGFKTFVKDNLILRAQIAASIDVPLQLGDTQQRIEVSASSVLVDTETANTSITLDNRLLTALPNSTRNPLNFVFAVAGTTEAPGGQTQRSGSLDQMSSNFGLNGGRTGDESILIDGAPSQAVDWGGLMVSPLQDSVQEQQIIQNTYDAQYERGGAGIVTLITKGGTNTFHGEVYDYLQNSVLNANGWYNNKNGFPRGPFKQNQFGFNVGGPILKRANLFFFGGYEGLRQPNTQSSGLLTVPTLAERSGDFSSALNSDGSAQPIYNPFTSTEVGGAGSGVFTRSQFAGNVIPANLINPVGQKIVNLYPLPNRAGVGPNQAQNFDAQGSGNTLNDKMDTRVDWDQSAKHRLFVRWSDRFRQDQVYPCYFCNGADTNNNQYNNGYQVVINDTVTPNPSWIINTYVSYSRWQEQHIDQNFGQSNASTIGLSPADFQAPLLPTINDNDQIYSNLGNGSYQTYTRYSNTIQMNLTKQFSRHTLKFGGNFDDMRINSVSESSGNFSFGSALTSCDPDPNGGPCIASNTGSVLSGNTIASTLLGTASGGGQSINIDPAMGLHSFGLYIQDQWRLTSRVTLNAGVRWENQRPATERFNRINFFDTTAPNPIGPAVGLNLAGEFQYAGVNGNSRYAWSPNNKDFAPRAGIAWKVTDKLVARIGAGIFYLPPSAMITFDGGQFYGFSSNTDYIGTDSNGYVPTNLVSNPFPNGINQPQGSSLGGLTLVGNGQSQIFLKGNHPTPYSEDWSFNLQYQVNSHSVLQAGYSGNKGRKLLYGNPNINIDQLPTQDLALGNQLNTLVNNPFYGIADPSVPLGQNQQIAYNQLLRPYPQYTDLEVTRSLPGARSSFNALNVKYNYIFGSGLSLLTTYQWSKALDNGPEDNFGWATGNSWRDSYNTMLDYNISTHDVPQSFTTALVYELPYGRGKRWGSNAPGIVKEVLGNWQTSTVVRLTSGLPTSTIVANYNNPLSAYGFPGNQLPDRVPGVSVKPTGQSPDNWINAAAFSFPTSDFVYGNAAERESGLRERAVRNVDFSIAKNLGGERYQVWIRGEFLNLFNYAQYNNFCVDLTNSSCQFGVAQGTENTPRTIQLSLKLQF